jgi:hypothetical protein
VIKFAGDHNSKRPSFFMDSVSIFFQNTLQVDAILTENNKMSETERQEFLAKMEQRRASQKKALEKAQEHKDPRDCSAIDMALGLDDNNDLVMPELGGFGGDFGGYEEDDLAAAIAASLADLNPNPTGMQQ